MIQPLVSSTFESNVGCPFYCMQENGLAAYTPRYHSKYPGASMKPCQGKSHPAAVHRSSVELRRFFVLLLLRPRTFGSPSSSFSRKGIRRRFFPFMPMCTLCSMLFPCLSHPFVQSCPLNWSETLNTWATFSAEPWADGFAAAADGVKWSEDGGSGIFARPPPAAAAAVNTNYCVC